MGDDDDGGFEFDQELEGAVEAFIETNSVEGEPAQVLRDAAPAVQRAVLGRGGLSGARNPSSVLMARIRDASAQLPAEGSGSYVKMRGLPFQATPEEIVGFLDTPDVGAEHVTVGTASDGRPTGEAFVQFPSKAHARDAIEQKNMQSMGGRYIELFPSTAVEAQRHGGAPPAMHSAGSRRGGGASREGVWGPSTEELDTFGGRQDSISADEVERFLSSSRVDDRAADALRELPPHVQRVVIERGNLDSARNPSSVLLSRVRDALKVEGTRSRVEAFLREHDVDARAADALWDCEPEVQEEVMRRGIATARNPSSALLARIRDCGGQQQHPTPGPVVGAPGPAVGAPPPARGAKRPFDALGLAIEEFIGENAVDERAADALRECPPEIQEAVMGRGNLHGTRNPSSVLLARIRDVQSGPPPGAGPHGGAGPAFGAPVPSSAVGAPRPSTPRPSSQMHGPPPGYPTSQPVGPPPVYSLPAGLVDDIEEFLRHTARSGRDPMAADLLGHVEYIKYGGRPPAPLPAPGPPWRPPPESHARRDRMEGLVEDFLRANPVDGKAADALRRCDPEVQRTVLDKGIAGARNPSSALLARIRDAEGPRGGPPGGSDRGPPPRSDGPGPRSRGRGGIADEVEDFLRDHAVDDKAAATFRRCDPGVQREVISRGIAGARNPSSALQARIKDAEARLSSGSFARGGDRGAGGRSEVRGDDRGGGRGGRRSRSRSRDRYAAY